MSINRRIVALIGFALLSAASVSGYAAGVRKPDPYSDGARTAAAEPVNAGSHGYAERITRRDAFTDGA